MVFEWQCWRWGGWVITLIDRQDGREGTAFPACITRVYIAAMPALPHIIMHAQWKTGKREKKNKNTLLGYKFVSSSKTVYDQLP